MLKRIAKEGVRVKKVLFIPIGFVRNTIRLLVNSKKPVSIVIPVYNDEKYVRDCLDSITSQKNPMFEIICVEDGSDDRSFEILQEYAQKDDRIRIIRKEKMRERIWRESPVRWLQKAVISLSWMRMTLFLPIIAPLSSAL